MEQLAKAVLSARPIHGTQVTPYGLQPTMYELTLDLILIFMTLFPSNMVTAGTHLQLAGLHA